MIKYRGVAGAFQTGGGKLAPFLLWLVLFYSVWVAILLADDHLYQAIRHWPIAAAMTLGSYLDDDRHDRHARLPRHVECAELERPGSLGRNFGLAIQSIGMVSASIYILCRRQPVDWKLLRPALLGSLIGTPLGCFFVAPFVPDIWVKLTFAVIWASFGIMHLVKMRELVRASGESTKWRNQDRPIGLAAGILGGVVASITGVGIDMIIYAILVLLYRADLRISIPTSVILMAFTSVIGIGTNLLLSRFNPGRYGIDPEVFHNWLAAAPVVALGAPLGAFVVNLIARKPTLIIVSVLCVFQFAWTAQAEKVHGWNLVGAIALVLLCNAAFMLLYKLGEK